MLPKTRIIALYNAHNKEIFHYLSRLVSDSEVAEDLLHDTFERFIKYSVHTAIDETTVRAFLYKTAHNLAVNHIRSRSRKGISTDSLDFILSSEEADLGDSMSLSELTNRIKRYLDNLDPEGRSIFILHKENGKTYEQISEEIGISARTVRRRMKTIIDELSHILKTEGFY